MIVYKRLLSLEYYGRGVVRRCNCERSNPIELVLRPVSLIETPETRQVWKGEKTLSTNPKGRGAVCREKYTFV
jgi:hypothetical protein